MRKFLKVVWFISVFLLLFFSSIPNSAHAQVNIPDPNLKAAIEAALGVTDPTQADMLNLTSLTASNTGIVNLTGLETATNLTTLYLSTNQINDITAVSGLTNLTILDLRLNQISDISPISILTNLTALDLISNPLNAAAQCTYIPLLETNNPGLSVLRDTTPYNCSNIFISVVPASTPADSPNGVTFLIRSATVGGPLQIEIAHDVNSNGIIDGGEWVLFRSVFTDNVLDMTTSGMLTGDHEPVDFAIKSILNFDGGSFMPGDYVVRVENENNKTATATFTLTPVPTSITVTGHVYEH
jgi:hypothetical protein